MGGLPWHDDFGRSNTSTSGRDGGTITNPVNPVNSGKSVSGNVSGEAAWSDVPAGRPWRYIVIHHSATPFGSAAEFDVMHKARGWEGLGYHFVIDNGNGGPDGRVEVGFRWRQQKQGAHTGHTPDNEYNEHGIGVCLVGDFSHHLPSQKQLAAMHRLVSYLAARYDIPPGRIIGHRDAPNASTECPGDALHAYIHSTGFHTLIARR